ncbi:23S rRNA accumulation protein YceD [Alteromonas aestuariivivens]|uniref:Large ribosomal RNA subunit accumulation protein YceD n=1 Tax=Alteromonas aestuariivivens TaxID=1938339 RepID=A0A3D8MBR7_9ALTE|nr:23S rRNA accumulation protein YceD [Alteromonas aestuariivivens]RDV27429.1 23S rRNA accumulation protein YceD [Alteromonas aestuariivivens]
MQKVKLPHSVEPVKSAMKRSDYRGVMASKDMERLCGTVVRCDDWVDAEVQFEKDAQGLTVFHGHLDTQVTLLCQRCNGEFDFPLHVTFCFSPVQGHQDSEELPAAYDPVEVNDQGEVDLLQLFEDELILSLPIVPLHAEEDCTVSEDDMQFGEIEPEQERPNPFAVLKELKRDQE